MANFWTTLKNSISAAIKSNDAQEITGDILQGKMNEMVDALGQYATFAGVMNPGTAFPNPGKPVFYLPASKGTYGTGSNTINVEGDRIVLLSNVTGTWAKYQSLLEIDDAIKGLAYGNGYRFMMGPYSGDGKTAATAYRVGLGNDSVTDAGVSITHWLISGTGSSTGKVLYVDVDPGYYSGYPADDYNAVEAVLIIDNAARKDDRVCVSFYNNSVRMSYDYANLNPGFNYVSVLLNRQTGILYVNNMSDTMQFKGYAEPDTMPVADGPAWYVANTTGVYTNFKLLNGSSALVSNSRKFIFYKNGTEAYWSTAKYMEIDSALSETSANPVQNKAVTKAIEMLKQEDVVMHLSGSMMVFDFPTFMATGKKQLNFVLIRDPDLLESTLEFIFGDISQAVMPAESCMWTIRLHVLNIVYPGLNQMIIKADSVSEDKNIKLNLLYTPGFAFSTASSSGTPYSVGFKLLNAWIEIAVIYDYEQDKIYIVPGAINGSISASDAVIQGPASGVNSLNLDNQASELPAPGSESLALGSLTIDRNLLFQDD